MFAGKEDFYGFPAPSKLTSTVYSTAGTYTWYAPQGVYQCLLIGCGGGGGGTAAGGSNQGSIGGTGALVSAVLVSVVPGQPYVVTIGAGGSGGVSGGASATSGGNSTFSTLATFRGATTPISGSGSTNYALAPFVSVQTNGADGYSGPNTDYASGGTGGTGVHGGSYGPGGNGGAASYGAGGNGGNNGVDGSPGGVGAGGGGGGGQPALNQYVGAGGKGGDGQIIIYQIPGETGVNF